MRGYYWPKAMLLRGIKVCFPFYKRMSLPHTRKREHGCTKEKAYKSPAILEALLPLLKSWELCVYTYVHTYLYINYLYVIYIDLYVIDNMW